jgi:diguanylate cyclase (GGDEF)-like protein
MGVHERYAGGGKISEQSGSEAHDRETHGSGHASFETGTAGDHSARDADFAIGQLHEAIRQIPIGVTLQDHDGRFLFVNEAAGAQFNLETFAPESPSLFPYQQLKRRQDLCIQTLRTGQSATSEERVAGLVGVRELMSAHTPVRLSDRTLLLTSTVDVTEQKARERELFHLAYYDELTGLATRRLVESRVGELLVTAGQQKFALVFLDVDNFKNINDYYGHSVGDFLLKQFAQRIGFHLRDTDLLGRISGDEFLLLLNPVQSDTEIAEFIAALLERLKAPYLIDGSEVFASASIGVSCFPEHGQTYQALCQNADIAMYQAKARTKGTFAVFDAGMERETVERTRNEQSLRFAIQDRKFCCAFQTKVDIRSQEVKGVEALVRLRNESGLLQAPGTFIELATELGLIDRLTHLVLDEIMGSIDQIDSMFGKDVSISINVAAKQAGNLEFMRSFARALEATGCAKRFMVEVTEDAFLTRSHFQTEILPLLRNIGVGVSIDDFGAGYSSLSALADITADEIKIDRSFITDIHKRPRSQSILKAIESLSEAPGMTVIAEGVETFEELAYLQAATKIRYAQGFYFSRPVLIGNSELDRLPLNNSGQSAPAGRTLQDPRAVSASRRR